MSLNKRRKHIVIEPEDEQVELPQKRQCSMGNHRQLMDPLQDPEATEPDYSDLEEEKLELECKAKAKAKKANSKTKKKRVTKKKAQFIPSQSKPWVSEC